MPDTAAVRLTLTGWSGPTDTVVRAVPPCDPGVGSAPAVGVRLMRGMTTTYMTALHPRIVPSAAVGYPGHDDGGDDADADDANDNARDCSDRVPLAAYGVVHLRVPLAVLARVSTGDEKGNIER